jgi:hypothetical protein
LLTVIIVANVPPDRRPAFSETKQLLRKTLATGVMAWDC